MIKTLQYSILSRRNIVGRWLAAAVTKKGFTYNHIIKGVRAKRSYSFYTLFYGTSAKPLSPVISADDGKQTQKLGYCNGGCGNVGHCGGGEYLF